MKSKILLVLVLASTTFVFAADYYKVNISRVDQDLYKDHNSGNYIQTRYCYEYVYYQDALLKYEPYSYSNKLIFENDNTCDVEKVFQ